MIGIVLLEGISKWSGKKKCWILRFWVVVCLYTWQTPINMLTYGLSTIEVKDCGSLWFNNNSVQISLFNYKASSWIYYISLKLMFWSIVISWFKKQVEAYTSNSVSHETIIKFLKLNAICEAYTSSPCLIPTKVFILTPCISLALAFRVITL